MKILIVINDNTEKETLNTILSLQNKYRIVVKKVNELTEEVSKNKYDMIVIDVEVCKIRKIATKLKQIELREKIKFVALVETINEKILKDIYESGIEDYIIKPFFEIEIIFKIEKWQKQIITKKKIIINDEIIFDFSLCRIYHKANEISLPKKEYELLKYFIKNHGLLISKEKILNDIWGYMAYELSENIIDVYLSKLRKRIPMLKEIIKVKKGIGYLLETKYIKEAEEAS